MNDTLRTDAETLLATNGTNVVPADFARTLERELAAKDDEISYYLTELAQLRLGKDEMLAATKSERDAAQVMVDLLLSERDSALAERNEARSRSAALQADLTRLGACVLLPLETPEDARHRIQRTEYDREMALAKVAELEAQRDEARTAAFHFHTNETVRMLTKAYESANRDANFLLNERDTLRAKVKELEAERDEAIAKWGVEPDEVTALMSERNDLRATTARMREALQAAWEYERDAGTRGRLWNILDKALQSPTP